MARSASSLLPHNFSSQRAQTELGYHFRPFETTVEDAFDWFVEHGYDKKMGARPMLRLIQAEIKKPLAEDILFGKLMHGGDVHISVENDRLCLEIKANKSAKKTKDKQQESQEA